MFEKKWISHKACYLYCYRWRFCDKAYYEYVGKYSIRDMAAFTKRAKAAFIRKPLKKFKR